MQTPWIALAGLSGLLFLIAIGRFLLGLRSEPELRGLPPTPLQRLAWLGLGASLSAGAGLGLVVAVGGASGLEESAYRWVFWVLLVVGIGAWMTAWHRTNRHHGGAIIDERDRAILARSLSVESIVVLLALVAWMMTLTEVFREEGTMPIAYVQLLFWSTFLVAIFGRSLGIILGYRQAPDA
jgi:hypothetical protein